MKVPNPKKYLNPFCRLFNCFQKQEPLCGRQAECLGPARGNPLHSLCIFTLCFLFSFNSFAVGGGLLKLIHGGKLTDSPPVDKSHQSPTPEETEALARQQKHDGTMDNIHGISERAVHYWTRDVDEQFNQTLDEILETRNIDALPGDMLDELKAATTDPLRLFDPDNPPGFAKAIDLDFEGLYNSVHSFPLPGQITEEILVYRDIYRAFFQKRLDLENSQQMYRLRKLLDRLVKKLETNDPYEALRLLCKHEGLDEDAYKNWSEKLMASLFEDEIFKGLADDCFKDGFDEKTFFTLWVDKSFREFIVNSKFMTKDHLVAGNVDLLIRWKKEQANFSDLMDDQLDVLIISSLREASLTSNAGKALSEDPFWQTLIRATSENLNFAEDFERRLRRITPVEQDHQPPRGGSPSGGGLA